MPSRFPSFPACCQPLLEELDRQNKLGNRNCPNGHLISLEYAQQVEAERARAAEAEKAATPPPAPGEGATPAKTSAA